MSTDETSGDRESTGNTGAAGGRHGRAAILEAPLAGTLLRMTWPMTVTALISSWQGLIAIFWVGRMIGTFGLTTIAIWDPVFVILGLLSASAHIGVQVLTARATGRGDGQAIPVIVNGMYLGLAWAVVVAVVGLSQLGPITHALAGNTDVATGLRSFLVPWLLFYPVPVISGIAIFAVDATGWTRFGLIQTTISIVFVAVLMPVFVGAFDLGLAGVAISDGCSDTLLLLLTCAALYKFRNGLGLGDWSRRNLRVDFRLWWQVARVGVLYQAARAMDFVAQAVMVRIIIGAGRDADVAAYGLTLHLITMPTGAISCFGVAASIVIGQNVGAGKPARAKATLRLAVKWLALAGGGLIAIASFPEPLLRLFTDDAHVIARATATIGVLRWTIPAALVSGALLRAYTAISSNRLSSMVSIFCSAGAIVVASVLPGTPLERVGTALIASQYLRLLGLALLYRRSFASVVG
ncbi:MAG: family efflux transporter [Myxococcales bacterium]|nr:family efflux transporter [Myxococcales bacterium]